ncbi:hypothetical protein CR513_09174, partial [Mucuna pruriens]
MHQLDVKSAFQNGPLEEKVYVDQPHGFVVKGKENKVYKLKKVLHQEPRIGELMATYLRLALKNAPQNMEFM